MTDEKQERTGLIKDTKYKVASIHFDLDDCSAMGFDPNTATQKEVAKKVRDTLRVKFPKMTEHSRTSAPLSQELLIKKLGLPETASKDEIRNALKKAGFI